MDKSPDAFRTISEVAEWLGVQAHVLRFWESKFSQVKPVKRAGGRRYYRPADMLLLGGIKKLLHDDGLTIKGAQKTLREQGIGHVSSLSQELCEVAAGAADTATKDAKVVPFQTSATAPEPDPSQIIDGSAEEVVSPPEPATTAAPNPMPSDPEEQTAPPAPIPVEEVVEEPAVLPSFLHRPAAYTKEPTPAPESEAPAPAKPSLVVDAPDPPVETNIPYIAGPLAKLAGLNRLSADQAANLAPVARQLRAWLDQSHGPGAG